MVVPVAAPLAAAVVIITAEALARRALNGILNIAPIPPTQCALFTAFPDGRFSTSFPRHPVRRPANRGAALATTPAAELMTRHPRRDEGGTGVHGRPQDWTQPVLLIIVVRVLCDGE
ncbi:hypothetical protein ACTWPT_58335 [Nonomuraea sp. 3N208]|uniref:hypothetical protein n=1 Tax=Nonomuraea sp. 3N208 TaxID=3457421 RepID=UPI003FD361C0